MLATCSYFELEPKRRLNLTDEEFDALVKYECMKRGVAVPVLVGLKEVPEEPSINQDTYFQIMGDQYYNIVCFKDENEARAFMDFKSVVRVDWDYATGVKYQNVTPVNTLGMQPIKASTVEVFAAVKKELKDRADIIKENTKIQEDFKKESIAHDELVEEMERDRRDLMRNVDEYLRIRATFARYIVMAQGDAKVATGFMLLIYEKEKLDCAYEWLKDEWEMLAPAYE